MNYRGNTPNLLAVRGALCAADSMLTHCSFTTVKKTLMHANLCDPSNQLLYSILLFCYPQYYFMSATIRIAFICEELCKP